MRCGQVLAGELVAVLPERRALVEEKHGLVKVNPAREYQKAKEIVNHAILSRLVPWV